jgi:hypothetical protein
MGLLRVSPSATIVSPDTNYGDSVNLWTNTSNARDGSSATFAQVLNTSDYSAARWQTPGTVTGQFVLLGMDIDWEISFSGSDSTNSNVAVFWQKTAGVTLESAVLGNNFGAGPVRTLTPVYLSPALRQTTGLTYLTVRSGGAFSGFTTLKVYEIRFIYADRGVASITSG